jgi:hypothetical protein
MLERNNMKVNEKRTQFSQKEVKLLGDTSGDEEV